MIAMSSGGVVLHQLALDGSLSGSNHGKLRSTVGRGDDPGREVLVGVEALDRGHAVEADAILAFDGFGKEAKLGDAGASGEERGFKLGNIGTDWSDTA